MANSFAIKIDGIKEVRDYIKKAGEKEHDKVNDAIHTAGIFMQDEVVSSIKGERAEPTSVDTGRFMGSVKVVNDKPFESVVDSDVEYAQYLEYPGPSNHWKNRRHFANSKARNEKRVVESIQKAVNDATK